MLECCKAASRACAAALLAQCESHVAVHVVFVGASIGAVVIIIYKAACRGFLASRAIATSTLDAFISNVDPSSHVVRPFRIPSVTFN